jgi:hypothetical protein
MPHCLFGSKSDFLAAYSRGCRSHHSNQVLFERLQVLKGVEEIKKIYVNIKGDLRTALVEKYLKLKIFQHTIQYMNFSDSIQFNSFCIFLHA